jgi:hypothetical protein
MRASGPQPGGEAVQGLIRNAGTLVFLGGPTPVPAEPETPTRLSAAAPEKDWKLLPKPGFGHQFFCRSPWEDDAGIKKKMLLLQLQAAPLLMTSWEAWSKATLAACQGDEGHQNLQPA